MAVFKILCAWSDEAKVWAVVRSNVPGLVGEAPTEDALAALLNRRVPELLELNRHLVARQEHGGERWLEVVLIKRRRIHMASVL